LEKERKERMEANLKKSKKKDEIVDV
jgi:hypothetical protein